MGAIERPLPGERGIAHQAALPLINSPEPLGIRLFFEKRLHGGQSALERERLLEHGGVFGEIELGKNLLGVARHVDHLHVGILLQKAFRQFGSSHFWEDQVGDQELDLRIGLVEELERVFCQIRGEHLVVVVDEQAGDAVAHRLALARR